MWRCASCMRTHGNVSYVILSTNIYWLSVLIIAAQRTLRKLVPNIPFQALVRGANGVGYTSYPYVYLVPIFDHHRPCCE